MDDAELLHAYARTRDDDAFAELVRRHAPLVYSAALRRMNGDHHSAQDVAQRVFVALARHAGRLARHPVLSAWLHQSTRHAALEHLRARSRRLARETRYATDPALGAAADHGAAGPDGALPPAEHITSTAVDWDRLSPLLDAALDALGDTERQVLLLRYFTGASYAEVGARLRLSEAAAQMRAARALEKLRRLLARRGVTSTASALGLALGAHGVAAAPAGFTAATVAAVAAVASAPATGALAGAAASLTLMNTSTKLGLVAVVALGVGLGGGWTARSLVTATPPTAVHHTAASASAAELRSASAATSPVDTAATSPDDAAELARLRAELVSTRKRITQLGAELAASKGKLEAVQLPPVRVAQSPSEVGYDVGQAMRTRLELLKRFSPTPAEDDPRYPEYVATLDALQLEYTGIMIALNKFHTQATNVDVVSDYSSQQMRGMLELDDAQTTRVRALLRASYEQTYGRGLPPRQAYEQLIDNTQALTEQIQALLTPAQKRDFEGLFGKSLKDFFAHNHLQPRR